jgi:hypothetical protein
VCPSIGGAFAGRDSTFVQLRPFLHLRVLIATSVVCAAGSIAVLVAMRRGVIPSNPGAFASLSAVVLSAALMCLIVAIWRRAVPAVLFSLGLLLIYGGGMANFLFSLQGYTILAELDSVRLANGRELQQFEAGPLSNVAEMDLTLQLEKVELLRSGDGFVPVSRVRVIRKGRPANVVTLSSHEGATDGTLRFSQGAFGFAPRIVVTRDGEAVFDRYVPFTTRRAGGGGVSFEETFLIGAEKMTVRGALDLASLDDDLRGHARLGVFVSREGRELGRGELTMGHFGQLSDGSHIGYAGIRRWVEIDISRRNYREPVIAGAALVVLSALAVPFIRRRA